jgi:glutathione S-transferase
VCIGIGATCAVCVALDIGPGVAHVRAMKLYHTPTSPFVRKVMVVAHERGLADRIETVFLRPTPVSPDPVLSRSNPLSKIPALVIDGTETLYDSHVICEYLDTLGDAPRLLPERGPSRFTVLRREALADGMLDAGISSFYERTMRPAALQWDAWLEGQTQKVRQALDALEGEAPSFPAAIDLGLISIAVTLGWLEFRVVLPDLFAGRPALERWYRELAQRPSMQATIPHT